MSFGYYQHIFEVIGVPVFDARIWRASVRDAWRRTAGVDRNRDAELFAYFQVGVEVRVRQVHAAVKRPNLAKYVDFAGLCGHFETCKGIISPPIPAVAAQESAFDILRHPGCFRRRGIADHAEDDIVVAHALVGCFEMRLHGRRRHRALRIRCYEVVRLVVAMQVHIDNGF